MRRITLLVLTATMLGGGTIAAIEGCSSSDTPTATPDSGAGSTSSGASGATSSGETSSGTVSSTSSGAIPPVDSGPIPGTVPASNPGQYTCGATTCDGGGDPENAAVCCQQVATVTGTACVLSNNCDNQGPDAGLQVQCDESADCQPSGTGHQVCCYEKDVEGFNGSRTTFQTICSRARDCNGFDQTTGDPFPLPVLCHSSSDCSDAGVVDSGTAGTAVACNQKTCDGFTLFVCGTPIGCQ